MQADIAIIGGDPKDRLNWAIELRRKGLAVHSEYGNRKRTKMFARAVEETGDATKVLDVDKPADCAKLQELLLGEFRVETRRIIVVKEAIVPTWLTARREPSA